MYQPPKCPDSSIPFISSAIFNLIDFSPTVYPIFFIDHSPSLSHLSYLVILMFLSIWFFFHERSRFTEKQGKVRLPH